LHMIFDCPHYTAFRAEYAELFIGQGECLHEFLSHHPTLVATFLIECKNTRILSTYVRILDNQETMMIDFPIWGP